MPLVAAIDVGTGSARAGIFDATGRLLGRAEQPIDTHAPAPGHAEQDSTRIWRAAAAALRAARAEAAARPAAVAGLAFDATCSLVLRDAHGRPVTVSETGEDHPRPRHAPPPATRSSPTPAASCRPRCSSPS